MHFVWFWRADLGFFAVFAILRCSCRDIAARSRYRRVPFTYPTPGFRDNLPLRCFLLILGFVGFNPKELRFEFCLWSQLYSLRVLQLFWLMAAKLNTPRNWPIRKRVSQDCLPRIARAQNSAPAAEGVNFLTLSWQGRNS
jgi:hypothetical protein